MNQHIPTETNLNQKTRSLAVSFDNGECFKMS